MARPKTVPLGELPPVGVVPELMYAQVIRSDRLGDPRRAFAIEQIPVPEPQPQEVLVAVMAAGINYNNVWAARGVPVDVIAIRKRVGSPHDFHVGGSDASGIVYAVGEEVTTVKVGDHVVVHPGWWDPADTRLHPQDPMLSPTARIWGYDTNFGSFAQFALAQEHQILPKPERLGWVEAAASTLVGTTAYRMLHGWPPHTVKPGDVVLVWGGSGGVGGQAIQIARARGARVVAVVSDERRGEYCVKLGAMGYINRREFSHWGMPPHWDDATGQKEWLAGARAFGKRLWEIVGERVDPAIVIEHPGEATVPTSMFVAATGGMVVICAGTTGYTAVSDLRYHWVRQKRLQGSHGTNDEQAREYNALLADGVIDPCVGQVITFDEIPRAHWEMGEGIETIGNRVAVVTKQAGND